jgi:hypothetical protein
MSTFKCTCGALISDVEYPGETEYVVVQQSRYDTVLSVVGARLASFAESSAKGDWIQAEFGSEYPRDATTAEVAEDLLTRELTTSSQHMFRCKSCQRMYLQRAAGPDTYDGFSMDH